MMKKLDGRRWQLSQLSVGRGEGREILMCLISNEACADCALSKRLVLPSSPIHKLCSQNSYLMCLMKKHLSSQVILHHPKTWQLDFGFSFALILVCGFQVLLVVLSVWGVFRFESFVYLTSFVSLALKWARMFSWHIFRIGTHVTTAYYFWQFNPKWILARAHMPIKLASSISFVRHYPYQTMIPFCKDLPLPCYTCLFAGHFY